MQVVETRYTYRCGHCNNGIKKGDKALKIHLKLLTREARKMYCKSCGILKLENLLKELRGGK